MAERIAEVERARNAAGRGAWAEAYKRLRAVDPAGLSPRDLEALADAAWWLSQSEESFAARQRAYAAYAAAGEDGRVLEVANVVWCTGFEHDYSWIDLPTIGEHEPVHRRGIVDSEPGLYFLGMHFLYSMSSAMIHGVGRDAEHIARHIATRPEAWSEMGAPAAAVSRAG